MNVHVLMLCHFMCRIRLVAELQATLSTRDAQYQSDRHQWEQTKR